MKNAGAMREALRKWVGNTTETVAEIENNEAIIWIVKWGGEATNDTIEYGVVRSFLIGDMPVVSGDVMNCTAEEAFKALGRVIL